LSRDIRCSRKIGGDLKETAAKKEEESSVHHSDYKYEKGYQPSAEKIPKKEEQKQLTGDFRAR